VHAEFLGGHDAFPQLLVTGEQECGGDHAFAGEHAEVAVDQAVDAFLASADDPTDAQHHVGQGVGTVDQLLDELGVLSGRVVSEFDDPGTLVVEQHFAIVPERVIDADLSDAACRLYTVLLRYGQPSEGRMPGRRPCTPCVSILAQCRPGAYRVDNSTVVT
jgi:hypothetical protein